MQVRTWLCIRALLGRLRSIDKLITWEEAGGVYATGDLQDPHGSVLRRLFQRASARKGEKMVKGRFAFVIFTIHVRYVV